MTHAVSISIGSSKRNKVVEVELLGEMVRIEWIGTDGVMEQVAFIAVAGKGRKLTHNELSPMLDQLGYQPQLQVLN